MNTQTTYTEQLKKLNADQLLDEFFKVADKVGLVKNGKYISGIPEGSEEDVNRFYDMEDFIGYPEPQEINQN